MDRAAPALEFDRCAPWIAAALDNQTDRTGFTTHTLADVLAQIEAGEAQLWGFDRSAAVTEIIEYPQAKVLHFWLCGGEWTDLETHLADVSAWGKARGCEYATTAGRRGWDRIMARHGYRPFASVCGREL